MVAFVAAMLWQAMGSVREAVRRLNETGVFGIEPIAVSASAVTDRLKTLPADLFKGVLDEVLPRMQARGATRTRPLPAVVARARQHYTALEAFDGSTLDALNRQVNLIPEMKGLAGRIAAVLDLETHLPREIWYEEDSTAHDQTFWERVIATLKPGSLVLFDLGWTNYGMFDRLTEQGVTFLTRLKANAAFEITQILWTSPKGQDVLVRLGRGPTRCEPTLRVVTVVYQGKTYRYLTNELDPTKLPTEHVVALYWQRWRIEDAFNVVKRLLGLAYFAVSSVNGIGLQLWMTWVLYAMLVDLTDAVAEALHQPFQMVSMEMVYRGLAHFVRALRRGDATEPVEYLVRKAKLLGIVKQQRPKSLDALHLLTVQLRA
jgi:hypothetical protein